MSDYQACVRLRVKSPVPDKRHYGVHFVISKWYVCVVCTCVHMFTSVWMSACPSLGLCVEVRGQPFVSVLAFSFVFFFKRWQSRKGLGPSRDSLVFLPDFKHSGITVGHYTSAYLGFGIWSQDFTTSTLSIEPCSRLCSIHLGTYGSSLDQP